MLNIAKLHYITTTALLAEQACAGGVRWIQLRLKDVSYEVHKTIALEVQVICDYYGATLIINDNVALAAAINADGVHLGKTDMSPIEARQLLGYGKIIGSTANTLEDVVALSVLPIDYIGLGPFRFTTTKQNLSPLIGLGGYKELLQQLVAQQVKHPPVIGIGGIVLEDVPVLLQTGLHGIAVSASISAQQDVRQAAQQFIQVTEKIFTT